MVWAPCLREEGSLHNGTLQGLPSQMPWLKNAPSSLWLIAPCPAPSPYVSTTFFYNPWMLPLAIGRMWRIINHLVKPSDPGFAEFWF